MHDTITSSDAIILLAGDFKERIPAAAKLYLKRYAPLVILTNDGVFSGWSSKYNRNLYQVEWAEEELVKMGVPRENIVKLPYYGSSTMFDALAARRYLLQHQIKKIIITSSNYHTRRAAWTFRFVLRNFPIHVTVYPSNEQRIGKGKLTMEYLKYGYYLVRYGLFDLVPEMKEKKRL